MVPQLVEYDRFFKKKATEVIHIERIKPQIKQNNNIELFLNILGLIILIIGIYSLIYRRRNKDKNKRIETQKIIQFYHDIN